MSQKNISDLLIRYKNMLRDEKSVYFDSDEFEEIADFYDIYKDSEIVQAVIEEGLRQHPGNPVLLLKKVKLLIINAQYQDALLLMNGFSEDASDMDVLLLKAEIFLHMDNVQSALSIFDVLLEHPEDEFDFLDISDILKSVEMFKESIFYLLKGIEKFPQSIELYREIADNYRVLEDYDNAIIAYNRMLDIDPYSSDDWTDLGELYNFKREYAKAIEAFDFSLAINEFDEHTLYMKGSSLIMNGNLEKAIETLLEYTEINKTDETAFILISECYTELHNYEIAKQFALKAIDVNPESVLALKRMIYLLLDRDHYEETIDYLEKILDLESNDSNLFFLKADVLMSLEQFTEAEEAYNKALSLSTNEDEKIEILYSIGVLRHRQGKDLEALSFFEKIEPFRLEHGDLFLKMAISYAKTKQYDQCQIYLNKVVNEPNNGLSSAEIAEKKRIIIDLKEIIQNNKS